MSIAFTLIPNNIRTPGVFTEFDSSRAIQGAPAQPHVILMIGSLLSSGTAVEGEVKQILNNDQAEGFFGRGSMTSAMIKALKANNEFTPVFATALDDAGGTASERTIIPAGAATAAGTMFLYIHGVRITVAVASGDDAATVATALDAAIVLAQADDEIQFTSSEVAGTITLVARQLGEHTSDMDIRFNLNDGEEFPAGITAPIAESVPGAVNPSVAPAIAAIGATQFHTVICGFRDSTNIGLIESELDDRFGPLEQIEGQGFFGMVGSLSDHTTLGGGRNSAFSSIASGGLSPTTPWEHAAALGAVDAFEPDPARPRQTLRLKAVLAPAREDQFTRAEREILLNAGMATLVYDQSGAVFIERLITTFQTDALSNPSTVFLDITTPRTLARIRFDWRTRIAAKYPRHKLADDGTLFSPGQAVVTPNVIRAEALDLFDTVWEPNGLLEGRDQFAADLIVERDTADPNRLNAQLAPDLINQLRVTATSIQFLL